MNQHSNSLISDDKNSMNQSKWFGPFSLFRSPLFVIMTLSIVAITVLLNHYTQNLEISILVGVTLELLISMMIWQYLLLSRRLEDIQAHTADLQSTVSKSQNLVAEKIAVLNTGLSDSHRLVGEVGGELNRVLQSDKEMKESVTLLFEHLVNFFSHIENWKDQNLNHTKEIEQSFAALKSNTSDEFRLLHEDIRSASVKTVADTCKKLSSKISTAKTDQYKAIEQLVHQQFEHTHKSLIETAEELGSQISTARETQYKEIEQLVCQQLEIAHKNLIEAAEDLSSQISVAKENQYKEIEQLVGQQLERVHEDLGSQISVAKENQFKAIEQLAQQQIEQVRKSLIDALPRQLVREVNNLSLNYSRQFIATLTLFEDEIAALKVEALGSDAGEGESTAVKALAVSTALDRLNLELRRQLASLRQEFIGSNQSAE